MPRDHLAVVHALLQHPLPQVRMRNCPLLLRHLCYVTLPPTTVMEITLSHMTFAPAAVLFPGFGTAFFVGSIPL